MSIAYCIGLTACVITFAAPLVALIYDRPILPDWEDEHHEP